MRQTVVFGGPDGQVRRMYHSKKPATGQEDTPDFERQRGSFIRSGTGDYSLKFGAEMTNRQIAGHFLSPNPTSGLSFTGQSAN